MFNGWSLLQPGCGKLQGRQGMSTKKIATLFAALTVVILATIGVAYGAWTQQLNVNGTEY